MRTRFALSLGCLVVMGVACAPGLAPREALAHPPAVLNAPAEKAMVEEVQDFRRRMAKAIAVKDAAALRAMYADRFRYTKAEGTIELKEARIAAALAGEAAIETGEADDLAIQVTNGWAAVVTGRSKVALPGGKTGQIRWTAVYVRVGESWQLAASQATRLAPP